jgi:hypothetical protein
MNDPRAFRLAVRIETEDDPDCLAPISAFLFGVQQSQIGWEMALVIGR